MARYIKIIAHSNHRVTQRRVYKYIANLISDDKGNPMHPQMGAPIQLPVKPKKGPKMLKIEPVILIDGKRADSFSVEKIISYIQTEEAHISALDQVRAHSRAILDLKVKHRQNIKDLVTILDAKGDDNA